MTYDQATIEKAARLLCEKWGNSLDLPTAQFIVGTFAIDRSRRLFTDEFVADIEEALRRAVEGTK